MRVLKMVHPDGHPYWDGGEFSIIMPDGEYYPMGNHRQNFGHGYRLEVRGDGIYYQLQYCGSGYGKTDAVDRFPIKKIISSSEYDSIEYVGTSKAMSEELKNDLQENGIKI